jgi:hypothetical protein
LPPPPAPPPARYSLFVASRVHHELSIQTSGSRSAASTRRCALSLSLSRLPSSAPSAKDLSATKHQRLHSRRRALSLGHSLGGLVRADRGGRYAPVQRPRGGGQRGRDPGRLPQDSSLRRLHPQRCVYKHCPPIAALRVLSGVRVRRSRVSSAGPVLKESNGTRSGSSLTALDSPGMHAAVIISTTTTTVKRASGETLTFG